MQLSTSSLIHENGGHWDEVILHDELLRVDKIQRLCRFLLSLSASNLRRSKGITRLFISNLGESCGLVFGATFLVVDSTDALLDELISLDVV